MPPRAKFTVEGNAFEIFSKDESPTRVYVLCRPSGSDSESRGVNVASLELMKKGLTGNVYPWIFHIPQNVQIPKEVRGDIRMAMMKFTVDVMKLQIVSPETSAEDDAKKIWGEWVDFQRSQPPRINFVLL